MSKHISADLLALYAGGDLDAEECVEISEHVEGCSECRRMVQEFAALPDLLSSLSGELVESDLAWTRESVLDRVAKASRPRRWLTKGIGYATAAAVAAATLIGVFVPRRGSQEPPGTVVMESAGRLQSDLIRFRSSLDENDLTRRQELLPTVRKRSAFDGAVLAYNKDGAAELKLQTTDLNVLIILQLDGKEQEQ